MKLGSKKHLQNPKLPTAGGAAPVMSQRVGVKPNPKDFVPASFKKKKRK